MGYFIHREERHGGKQSGTAGLRDHAEVLWVDAGCAGTRAEGISEHAAEYFKYGRVGNPDGTESAAWAYRKNVTIGFIDTGIRYQEPVFRDFAGRSRIVSIWDQTIQTGTPPEGFQFGTEYTNEMINEALASDDPLSVVPSTDANGHGSMMASLAAGSSIENGSFTGAAPDCQIAVVKLKEAKPYLREYYKIPPGVPCYSEADILQAIQYLQKYVLILTRPLVICLGIGTSYGDHTGGGMLGRYLDYVSTQKSRVTVIAGGNEGNAAHHFFGSINDSQAYHDVEVRVGENNKGFIMDLWGCPIFLQCDHHNARRGTGAVE